ncbi:MAG: glutathione S-transferase family protein [Rhodospirillaceae bacterium]|nr:glutathione S-transferase family protein [Rhodospirillaceae bacterium]
METQPHLIIANKAYSSWSMRPWLAMRVNQVPFRETVVPLGQDDTAANIRKYSPAGKVPVLQHGGITVWDSLAILEYLADAFYDRPWWPADPHARAVARAVSAEMHSGFMALRQSMPMNVRKSISTLVRTPEVNADIARVGQIWSECRRQFGAKAAQPGPFLFGAFSNADAMYAPVATRFKTYNVSLDVECQAYADAILALPAMREWYAAAAKEPMVIAKYELG